MPASLIPTPGMPKPANLPAVAEATFTNGLRVVAAKRAGVPLVSFVLRIPTAGTALSRVQGRMLEGAMMLGTATRSAAQLAADLQALGAELNVSADADRIVISGATLQAGLPGYLRIVEEVLLAASYPTREIAGEKERLKSELAYLRSRPGALADEKLSRTLFGSHRYGAPMPTDTDVASVSAAALRKLHSARVVPSGSTLVLVGDVAATRLIAAAEKGLSAWVGKAVGGPLKAAAISPAYGVEVVDRPGSVQTTLLIGGRALPPGHEDEPALALANMVFGGYFSSRLVANIRERNGYTYSPRSGIAQLAAASIFTVQSDVATAVTAPALMETLYELGRIANVAVTEAELDSAKAYLIGTSAIALSTQSGVAGAIARLAAYGLPWSFVKDNAKRLAKTDASAVLAAAGKYLSPARLTVVAVGDASQISSSVEGLLPLR